MTINRNNFEAYLLDYLEGNLDPLLTADLMAFLAENPEFENYLPDLEGHSLRADEQQFRHKELLKKGFSDIDAVTHDNFEEFCIAYCEGILDGPDEARFVDFLAQNPGRRKDLELYKSIKLQPDSTLVYPGKSELRKPVPAKYKVKYLYIGLSVAASLAFALMLVTHKPVPAKPGIQTETALNKKNPGEMHTPSQAVTENASAINSEVTAAGKNSDNTGLKRSLPEKTLQVPVRESLTLSAIKPVSGSHVQSDIKLTALALPIEESSTNQPSGVTVNAHKEPENGSGGILAFVITRLDLWKTAETAVQGFNYLTESRISIGKSTDKNGNVTGLLLNTDRYTIEGNKIK